MLFFGGIWKLWHFPKMVFFYTWLILTKWVNLETKKKREKGLFLQNCLNWLIHWVFEYFGEQYFSNSFLLCYNQTKKTKGDWWYILPGFNKYYIFWAIYSFICTSEWVSFGDGNRYPGARGTNQKKVPVQAVSIWSRNS